MLQNRVDPSGNIIKTPARGAWMGNRGLIHDHGQKIIRSFRLLAWITCRLSFKGRKRPVMAPDQYTELFFLDEATSFAAGHRPCFECRREDAVKFKRFWLQGNPEYNFTMKTRIGEIDNILHEERMAPDRTKRLHKENLRDLPNGVFILVEDKPFLVFDGMLYLWTPFGYEKTNALSQAPLEPSAFQQVSVLTPKSVVNAFREGYLPQVASLP